MIRSWLAAAALVAVALGSGGLSMVAAPSHGDDACFRQSFEATAFTVCPYNPREDRLSLALRGKGGRPLGSLAELKADLGAGAARVRFAMNAGMYDRAQNPVGLYVAHGRTVHTITRGTGTGNFYLLPNGVFWSDAGGRPHVEETSAFAAHPVTARWATQSGPLLIDHGVINPQITPNGTSLNVRNGVGIRRGWAYFVISDAPVSFGRFARFFRDGLGCSDALYLDGTVSSLWAPSLNRMDRRTGLGTFVVVSRRAR